VWSFENDGREIACLYRIVDPIADQLPTAKNEP